MAKTYKNCIPDKGQKTLETIIPTGMNKAGIENLWSKRVYIETYGCRYNFGDTAKLKEILRHQDCTLDPSDDRADAVIINTCTVIAATERRMLRRLSRFRDRELYVTGCMPMVQQDAIRAVCSPVIIPPQSIHDSYQGLGTVGPEPLGIVQIAQGCCGHCTYCVTRIARGALKSYPVQEILSRIHAFIRQGAVEIQLTAQDVSAWGRDTGTSCADLLTVCAETPGTFRLRVGMMNPATLLPVLDDMVEAFAHERIFKFIHIPVQSGSDRVLNAMGRGYCSEEFEQVVEAFRKKYPDLTLATDMIVGFYGETERDFLESLALLDRIRPNKVNITRFSKRPFTVIGSGKELSDSEKKDRSRIMNARAGQIYHAINAPLLGRTMPFIVTERIRDGSVMARTPSYLGIVLDEDLPIGCTGYALIDDDHRYFLSGKRVAGAMSGKREDASPHPHNP
jgi:threonylcarbamoyladenosine tRNA methylthiotransferase CDKAL1